METNGFDTATRLVLIWLSWFNYLLIGIQCFLLQFANILLYYLAVTVTEYINWVWQECRNILLLFLFCQSICVITDCEWVGGREVRGECCAIARFPLVNWCNWECEFRWWSWDHWIIYCGVSISGANVPRLYSFQITTHRPLIPLDASTATSWMTGAEIGVDGWMIWWAM